MMTGIEETRFRHIEAKLLDHNSKFTAHKANQQSMSEDVLIIQQGLSTLQFHMHCVSQKIKALLDGQVTLPPTSFVVKDFMPLQQIFTVREYQQKFEMARSFVVIQYPSLDEDFFISCCINGLRGKIKCAVQLFRPSTVDQVFNIAVLQEFVLANDAKNCFTSATSSAGTTSTQMVATTVYFCLVPPLATVKKFQVVTELNWGLGPQLFQRGWSRQCPLATLRAYTVILLYRKFSCKSPS